MMLKVAIMLWLQLHAPGGNEVSINAKRITAMHSAEGGDNNRYVTAEARCVISTDDGKFISVIESCDEVREQLEALENHDRRP
jgi:hypothetical protein